MCDGNGKAIAKEKMRGSARQACVSASLRMTKIREEITSSFNGAGMTYFSEAFDVARRSWHFKIDVEANENVSLWLVERDAPVGDNDLQENLMVPSFSSVIIEFEMQ
jgi:hypothetical protein